MSATMATNKKKARRAPVHGPIKRPEAKPLSVRLWDEANAGATRDDAVMRPDVEVLLGDDSVLRLHRCLLARVSPYFEAALRFRHVAPSDTGVATIDCRESDAVLVRLIVEEAYCGTPSFDYECTIDQYVAVVRTYNRYLVPVPQHVRIKDMPRRFKIESYPSRLCAVDPVSTYHLNNADEMAAAVHDINVVIGAPVVRSLSWSWCNYYAPNSEADYEDLVVTMNGIAYNTGRHYVSSPASVSIARAIEYIIGRCLDQEDEYDDDDNNQEVDNDTGDGVSAVTS